MKTLASAFDWQLCPGAAGFSQGLVDDFLGGHGPARHLSERLLQKTSTRFSDWVDHAVLPAAEASPEDLASLGFEETRDPAPEGDRVFRHRASVLFPVLLSRRRPRELALKVEELDCCLQAWGAGGEPDAEPFSPWRCCELGRQDGWSLSAVERRGFSGFLAPEPRDQREYARVLSACFRRRRAFADDPPGVRQTREFLEGASGSLGRARLCDAFFRAERAYWQGRNRAAQVQKGRQDGFGLGWGNHDHHTYRSSRENFRELMRLFEALGFAFREKYHAGEKAGWGAQLLEHEACGIVVFADVDLTPDEAGLDFARSGLEHRRELGTVGLWVGLHGESLLQAGLHHLAARFAFDRLGPELQRRGAGVMPPFSDFPFLRQAFTAGEAQEVAEARLGLLHEAGSISPEQGAKFQSEGAIGSHLESIERNQGFKGFNKSSVTKIIAATDPRTQGALGA